MQIGVFAALGNPFATPSTGMSSAPRPRSAGRKRAEIQIRSLPIVEPAQGL